jgi:hypothetical protein
MQHARVFAALQHFLSSLPKLLQISDADRPVYA